MSNDTSDNSVTSDGTDVEIRPCEFSRMQTRYDDITIAQPESLSDTTTQIPPASGHCLRERNERDVDACEDLVELARPYFSTVDDLLDGRIVSGYYSRAKKLCQASNKSRFTIDVLRGPVLSEFIVGIYGIEKQFSIAEDILSEYETRLQNSRHPVVQWWGPDDFARYVLAPEVLITLELKIGQSLSQHRYSGRKPGSIHENLVECKETFDIRSDVYRFFQGFAEIESGKSTMPSKDLSDTSVANCHILKRSLSDVLSSDSSSDHC